MHMIEMTQRGNITVLRMTHGKANALDLELCETLTTELQACAASSARALVVIGQGKMFSAGVDLPRVINGGAEYIRVFLPAVNRMFETLFSFPKPVVAAVNGHAIAGGCIMACAVDYRLMAREPGRIGIPELLVGVPFPVVPLEIMRFAMPPPSLQSVVYRGTTFTADEALQQGLVDAVVDPERLEEEALTAAERLAALPAAAFRLTKRLLREPTLARIRAGAAIDQAVQDNWMSPETLTAIREYVARTLGKK